MTITVPDALYEDFIAACRAVDATPRETNPPFNTVSLERTDALLKKQIAMVKMVAAMDPQVPR